jgi:hypothetical protein
MSDHEVTMRALSQLDARLDWVTDALKYLLSQSVGATVTAPSFDEIEGPETEEPEDVTQGTQPPRPVAKAPTCSHNVQVLVEGVIKCGKCGLALNQSGVIGDPAKHGGRAAMSEWARSAQREPDDA